MAPERCNSSVSKKASLLAEKINNCKRKAPLKNSPTVISNCHSAQNIPRRSATKVPEHCECGKCISTLPSRKGHECPFRRRKRKAEKRHKGFQEHRGAFRAHAHVHPKFILRADVQRFGRELDGSCEGIYRNAEMEMRLRPNDGGTGRGIEDGERHCDWHPYIGRKK